MVGPKLWDKSSGAQGRTRTVKPCGGGFSYRFGFRRRRYRRSRSGARLHHSLSALGARRLLSTPSKPTLGLAWLGVSMCHQHAAFTEFDGLHQPGFPGWAQIVNESPASTNFATWALLISRVAVYRERRLRLRGTYTSNFPAVSLAPAEVGCRRR